MEEDIDILVITHNRPIYTRLTLERLFATCDETMRAGMCSLFIPLAFIIGIVRHYHVKKLLRMAKIKIGVASNI